MNFCQIIQTKVFDSNILCSVHVISDKIIPLAPSEALLELIDYCFRKITLVNLGYVGCSTFVVCSIFMMLSFLLQIVQSIQFCD